MSKLKHFVIKGCDYPESWQLHRSFGQGRGRAFGLPQREDGLTQLRQLFDQKRFGAQPVNDQTKDRSNVSYKLMVKPFYTRRVRKPLSTASPWTQKMTERSSCG